MFKCIFIDGMLNSKPELNYENIKLKAENFKIHQNIFKSFQKAFAKKRHLKSKSNFVATRF